MSAEPNPPPNLTAVAAGVHQLRLPIPWEDGWVNCYLLPGEDRVDVVDCGMNSEGTVPAIEAAVRELGGPSARLGTLLVTHIHPDHYGAAGALVAGGARLLLHRLEVPMVNPRYLEIEQLVEEVGRYLSMHGVPREEAERLKNASRWTREFVTPAAPYLILDGGETLELGSRTLRVEWTPGHSPGHVCLFDPSDHLLIAGDELLAETSPNIGLHPQSTPYPLDDYLDGLERLVRLEPDLILPGHGRPFTGAAERSETLRAHHDRRKGRMLGVIGSEELSAWEVAVGVWGRREDVHDQRLALQEGLAHLQSLSREGRLEKRARSGRISWRRPR